MNASSVLLVIDGEEPVRGCLERALMLARVLQARLDILLWRGLSPARLCPWSAEEARAYLHALRNSLMCPGVEISTQASFDGTLPEVIAQTIRRLPPVVVVKIRRHTHSWHGTVDCELMRACALPLLLTDGRPWAHPARLAGAVDVLREDSATARNIIQTSAALQRACAASLDLVFAEPTDLMSDAPEGESPAHLLLRQLAHRYHVEPRQIHVLEGKAHHVLPRFVGAMHYDLLAIGSPTEQRHAFWHFSAPTLVESLMKTGCDLLLVNQDHGHLVTALASAERVIRDDADSITAAVVAPTL